jgi:hypothetical protein
LRWNLFTYRDLWAWIDDPYETPPQNAGPEQLLLPSRLLDSTPVVLTRYPARIEESSMARG